MPREGGQTEMAPVEQIMKEIPGFTVGIVLRCGVWLADGDGHTNNKRNWNFVVCVESLPRDGG